MELRLAAAIPAEWKSSQSVEISKPGFQKFALPPETLDAARPGLEDLRVFDEAGREMPYLIERPAPQPPVTRAPKSFRAVLGDKSTVLVIETGLAQPLASLGLQTAAQSFLKSTVLEGSMDGARWEAISVGEPLYRQAGATRLTLPLPPRAWAFLRLTFDDKRTAPVIFTGATLHAAVGEPAPETPLAVSIAERDEQPGETRLTLRFAGANVQLTRLALQTSDPLFARPVRLAVREVAEDGVREKVFAGDSVSRIALEGQPAAEKAAQFDAVRLPARELVLTIENGDSPPLAITGVSAKQRPVYLAFNAQAPGTFQLASGNAKVSAPRYDLAALGGNVRATLLDDIRFGAPVANAGFRAPELLPDLQPAGAAIDLAKWRFRKALQLAGAGVQQLELDLDVLARGARSLADLRVVADGKQLPYVIERTSLQRALALTPQPANDPKRPSVSRWEFKLPRANLPLTRLDCASADPLFQRRATLIEEVKDERGEKDRAVLGEATWLRTPENKPRLLVLALTRAPRTDRVWLEVENGDNAPLALGEFTAWHSTSRLLFKAPTGSPLQLYYGNPDTRAPSYDLQLIAARLLAADKAKASLGAEETLRKPTWGETERAGGGGKIFWLVLGGVVVLLLVVLAKLLPKTEPPKP
ncbi:MAG: DUF3999 family protein [Verrucomicrobia bacterium]|nr:DUF3999 family protein [Verrucomicrobiota bacterium]